MAAGRGSDPRGGCYLGCYPAVKPSLSMPDRLLLAPPREPASPPLELLSPLEPPVSIFELRVAGAASGGARANLGCDRPTKGPELHSVASIC
jgi:hypothetical protein